MEKNLTTGGVFSTVIYFSLPYLFSYFLQTLYGMADLFIIGQFYGVDSTTAVAIGSQVMHMLTVMIVGLAMGATVVVGRAVGGMDYGKAARAIGNTATLFMALSLVLTAALLAAVGPIVRVMSTPAEAAAATADYLTICFAGIPFITAYNIISSIFRGMGDSKSPMCFVAVACAVNVGLDYLFIGGLRMDAAGAALATTISQGVSVAVALAVVRGRRTNIRLTRADFRPERRTMSALLKIGVPVSLQDGFIQIAFIVITIIANRRGLSDAAAVGIVEKIISVLFLVPSSMLSAVSALSAQNIGAGKHDRARQTLLYASAIAVGWGIFVNALMQLDAERAVSFFTEDARVVLLGGQYMRGYVWDAIFAGIHFCFSGYFCAYGLSSVSFVHNSLSMICVRVPLSYIASVCFTETLFPMGLASPAGSIFSVAICLGVFFWMERRGKSGGLGGGME